MLPIVSGLIKGSDTETVEASVFCDSGVQVSIIRTALAECLCLESKLIKIVITKVEGVEEDLDTKLYTFPVCGNNGRLKQTIRAVGIPQISDETSNPNVKYISSVLGILVNKLHRRAGPVDLLIGVNYPRFHIGETKKTEGFDARKSSLGYDSRDVLPQMKQVLHVRLATPTDITAFWKTGAIGVSFPSYTCEAGKMSKEEQAELRLNEESCKLQGKGWLMKYQRNKDPACLHSNYTQVLKKLESTERLMMKKPEYAKLYGDQVKEMEEMRFSKRSNLLNRDIFGLLIRFRENPVGLCGDITKMYHMIAIPPLDQHVHRFIWRDYETEREPDVYVKTVLTFRDRPAPTMAITAMRKTAEMSKESNPKAAETIAKNAYVDDICDSVQNVGEGKA
ncbi:uncharacterized protein [Acropora muricata]|uniref:uncharacterized protein n=1 Tax=Acropora muricata TaxID=159855 RepID=UPI0034E48048